MTARRPHRRLTLSAKADAWLEARADDLLGGRLELAELPRGPLALVLTGYALGELRAADAVRELRRQVADLEAECDRRYALAYYAGDPVAFERDRAARMDAAVADLVARSGLGYSVADLVGALVDGARPAPRPAGGGS